MGNLNIPTELTAEEEFLKKKYDQLRRLQNQLNSPKPKQEVSQQIPAKRTVKDAKEVAKKLLKSGAISAIKVENKDTQGFKRPTGSERKHNSSKKRNINENDNQYFSTSCMPNQTNLDSLSNSSSKSLTHIYDKQSTSVKSLYESFVNRGKLEDEIKEHYVQRNKK